MDSYCLADIAQSLAVFIASCIQSSCGDLIQADLKNNGLVTNNSKPSRIWDFIYSQLFTNASSQLCRVALVRRGPWEMVLLLDARTKLLFSVMREQRYRELGRLTAEERRFHYARALSTCLNADLMSIEKQTNIFENSMDNEEAKTLRSIVSNMLANMNISGEQVKHHAIVLFDVPKNTYEVRSVRCAMVDGDFDIIEQVSWSEYLLFTEGIIPDTVIAADDPHDNPTRGLRLTDKALRKRGDEFPKKKRTKEQDKETDN